MKDKLGNLKKLWDQRDALTAQLERQLHVEEEYGIKAHEISKIRLVPSNRDRFGEVAYSSIVTMKNGDKINVPDVNIRELLGEGVKQ